MNVKVLEEQEIRAIMPIDLDALDIVEDAFTWLAEGKVEMPPIMHLDVSEYGGDIDIKSAYVNGLGDLAVKLGSGFFNNPRLGLPSSSSTMVVMSAKTGLCEAVLLENGYLTNLRTGLAGAVAAKYLAPEKVDTVGVIGSGAQARFQIFCLRLVREFDHLIVFSRKYSNAERCATEIAEKLGIRATIAASAEELVQSSQIVVTATPSQVPIVDGDWLHEGLHITAIGADLAGKQELDVDCTTRADILVCDRLSQSTSMGEFQHSFKSGRLTDASGILELGQLTSGQVNLTRKARDITICDLSGMGVQDTAIASLTLRRHRLL